MKVSVEKYGKIYVDMGIRIGIGGVRIGESTYSWDAYWNSLIPSMAYKSGEFDKENYQWVDDSGNGNHVNILCPYILGNSAWGWGANGFLADYGFTTYHEFVYDSSNYTLIFAISSNAASNKQMFLITDNANNRMRLFNRVANVSIYGTTNALVNGTKYKVIVQWISKDSIKVYLDGSTTPDIDANAMNWTWQATWNKMTVHCWYSAAPIGYSPVGAVCQTKIKSGTLSWSQMEGQTGFEAIYYHQEYNSRMSYDYSGNNRDLTLLGTPSTASPEYYQGYSPHLFNGYDVYRKQYLGYLATDILLPHYNNGTSISPAVAYPFRPNNWDTDWIYWRKISASTTKWNGCDVRFSFPYNTMIADSDAVLGDVLFSGTTPNKLNLWDLWDDHNEVHMLFWNRNVTDFTIDTNEVRKGGYDLVLFRNTRTDYEEILKYQYGYDTTPYHITASDLGYRMNYVNDSFKLNSNHLLASKLAGLYYLFFCGEDSDDPIKTRFEDIERINHRNIFCDQSSNLWIYKKPLLPSHLETAINTHFGLTDIEHLITTRDGIDYYNLDYEKYTLSSNTINFNPNATANTKYDIFDRRNVVGSAKEIWDVVLLAGANYWTWNIDLGTKKMYEPTVWKYIQPAYEGKLFVRQDYDKDNRLLIPYIISFNTPLAGASKTAMFNFIDFPETIDEPAIVGDGITDDATQINASMGLNDAVMLYEKDAVTLSEIKIPDDTELILADSEIKLGDDVNVNIIRNDDWSGGNVNIKLTGYGESRIDGNGANQDRTAQEPQPVPGTHYLFIAHLFINVDGLKFSGVTIHDTMFWGWNSQKCDDVLVEHVIMDQLDSQDNQDGIGIGFGTRYSIVRYLRGWTADDFIAMLNYDDTLIAGIHVVPEGTRTIEWIYYRDINQNVKLPGLGGGLIRVYDNQDKGIQNIEHQNIYTKRVDPGHSTGWFIHFGCQVASTADVSYNFIFKNLKGSATNNIIFQNGLYSNININKIWVDDSRIATSDHIRMAGGTFDTVYILSDIDYNPTNIYTYTGGTITNFTHIEI